MKHLPKDYSLANHSREIFPFLFSSQKVRKILKILELEASDFRFLFMKYTFIGDDLLILKRYHMHTNIFNREIAPQF